MEIDDETKEYFEYIDLEVSRAYKLAEEARKLGLDPETRVDIPVAEDLAARVEGLLSTTSQDFLGCGLKEGIRVLEAKYGKNDERVALFAGLDTAKQKYIKYDTLEKAIDSGVRVAVAYLTLGLVTAPLEGISDIKIKKNPDGSEYLAIYYSGPIRSAGGTASAMSVLAADFIRLHLGLDVYKPSETEVQRYVTEVEDYYSRVTAKQYHPTKEEIEMIIKNVMVEITGDPTEKLEVSNFKDLERVETNKIRGGMCLVLLDGLPLKAEKMLKRVLKYPKDYKLSHWLWLKKFIKLKQKIHAAVKSDDADAPKYSPSAKYMSKVIAGRPVFSYPGRPGGFRLRYGRARTGGLASTALNTAAITLLEFTALGTQIATEFPGNATVCTGCDTIEPPVVLLKTGEVLELRTQEAVRKNITQIKEILSLGDDLIPYGEFVSNGHILLPSSYVEEWWAQELEQAAKTDIEKYKE
ncbi:MAG: DNA polymerase II large subunit, partial [Candidatus Aenigmarchaeota archaeon]|nr:DNA polymerase II large subunit [Candidatus Aenigmarchaeota archaeon]